MGEPNHHFTCISSTFIGIFHLIGFPSDILKIPNFSVPFFSGFHCVSREMKAVKHYFSVVLIILLFNVPQSGNFRKFDIYIYLSLLKGQVLYGDKFRAVQSMQWY